MSPTMSAKRLGRFRRHGGRITADPESEGRQAMLYIHPIGLRFYRRSCPSILLPGVALHALAESGMTLGSPPFER